MMPSVRDPLAGRPVVREWRPANVSSIFAVALAACAIAVDVMRPSSSAYVLSFPCLGASSVFSALAHLTESRERRRWLIVGWSVLAGYVFVGAVAYAALNGDARTIAMNGGSIVAALIEFGVAACVLVRRRGIDRLRRRPADADP